MLKTWDSEWEVQILGDRSLYKYIKIKDMLKIDKFKRKH